VNGRPAVHQPGDPDAPGLSGTGDPGLLRIIPLALALPMMAGAAHAAAGPDAGPDYADFGWRVLNFAVLLALIYWLSADKIKSFFSGRRGGIQTALTETEASRKAAQQTFQEYEIKLAKATGEIDEITAMIKAQGQAEKERLIEEGRKAAQKVREDAQARMEQAFSQASQALRIEAVRLSTEMAAELLKKNIQPADHEALVKDYIQKVVNRH